MHHLGCASEGRATSVMSASVGAVLLLVAPTVLGTNPIVAENLLPGSPSTEWDVNGAGNPDVEGFSTRASLLPGATVAFKVKTSRADEDLRIDIYRMGWYSGNGARLVGRATIDWLGGAALAAGAFDFPYPREISRQRGQPARQRANRCFDVLCR